MIFLRCYFLQFGEAAKAKGNGDEPGKGGKWEEKGEFLFVHLSGLHGPWLCEFKPPQNSFVNLGAPP